MIKQTLRLFQLFCALRPQNIQNRNYHISPTERRDEKKHKIASQAGLHKKIVFENLIPTFSRIVKYSSLEKTS